MTDRFWSYPSNKEMSEWLTVLKLIQNLDKADAFQDENVGGQVWEGVVGVPQRPHEEGHHSTGEDGNYYDIKDYDVEYDDSSGGGDDHHNHYGECYSMEWTPAVQQNIQNFILKVTLLWFLLQKCECDELCKCSAKRI